MTQAVRGSHSTNRAHRKSLVRPYNSEDRDATAVHSKVSPSLSMTIPAWLTLKSCRRERPDLHRLPHPGRGDHGRPRRTGEAGHDRRRLRLPALPNTKIRHSPVLTAFLTRARLSGLGCRQNTIAVGPRERHPKQGHRNPTEAARGEVLLL